LEDLPLTAGFEESPTACDRAENAEPDRERVGIGRLSTQSVRQLLVSLHGGTP